MLVTPCINIAAAAFFPCSSIRATGLLFLITALLEATTLLTRRAWYTLLTIGVNMEARIAAVVYRLSFNYFLTDAVCTAFRIIFLVGIFVSARI
jgi:hypothetical protein